jgi:hypothetical protein
MSEDLAGVRAATPPTGGRAPEREGSRQREGARPAVHSPGSGEESLPPAVGPGEETAPPAVDGPGPT